MGSKHIDRKKNREIEKEIMKIEKRIKGMINDNIEDALTNTDNKKFLNEGIEEPRTSSGDSYKTAGGHSNGRKAHMGNDFDKSLDAEISQAQKDEKSEKDIDAEIQKAEHELKTLMNFVGSLNV